MTEAKPQLDVTAPLPPGQFGLPILGETLAFFRDPDFAIKRHRQYGDVFKTRLLGQPTLFVRGAESNQFVLSHENQYFQIAWPYSTRVLLGSISLALQTGGEHASRRKILAQAFMPRALSGYMETITTITTDYAQRWAERGQVTWYPELRNYTLDIACKLLVGLDHGSATSLGHTFETLCQGLFSIPVALPWTRFGKAQRARRRLLTEIEQIIQHRQQQPDPGQDALGLLIQAEDETGDRLTVDELKDQILLLLFAGHETLTSAIASFCQQVALHPEVRSQLQAEQAQFLHQPLTLDTLKQMTDLEQVLQEVLRLVPPVGAGFRRVIQDCEWAGYHLPTGWQILYQIGATHHNPNAYPNPNSFDPGRFAPQASNADIDGLTNRYNYLPFGKGIRECLGKEFARLEMKLFAIHLLRHYHWNLLPDQNLSLVTIPTPHPRDGLKVQITCR